MQSTRQQDLASLSTLFESVEKPAYSKTAAFARAYIPGILLGAAGAGCGIASVLSVPAIIGTAGFCITSLSAPTGIIQLAATGAIGVFFILFFSSVAACTGADNLLQRAPSRYEELRKPVPI